ncbi:MAG: isoprenylcysteine carboxylmethyltransferase family protein [Treponema sp.]|nr:isoprenylcysteine carboxylmethyltransferase family protein [Treponema sp.]
MVVLYICSYAILAGFFLIERFVRKGKDTKNMSRTEFDRGSTVFISIVMGIAFILVPLSPLFNYFNIGMCFNLWVSICGNLLGIAGLFIRYFAFSALGRFFTRTLRKAEEHTLVMTGIYRYIRHPGYLSDLLIFIGVSFGMGNLLAMIAIPVMFIPAYIYRIQTEEKMLVGIFGDEYISYRKKTGMLLPSFLNFVQFRK